MTMCWHKNPKARPTFIELIEMLLKDVSLKFRQVSFYYTQHLTSASEMDEAATPNTPLRSSVREEDNDQNSYRYFPTVTQLPEGNHNHDSSDAYGTGASNTNFATNASNSNEGSKNLPVNYSDGSKGSKISNLSNGSVANGHISVNFERTTEC